MLSADNRLKHARLRSIINLARDGQLWPGMSYQERVSYVALQLTRLGAVYGKGGRYCIEGNGEQATRSRFVDQGDSPPALECAGFVEMALYGLGQINDDIFTYRGLRPVPRDTQFACRAKLGDGSISENWIPGKHRAPTMTELNDMGEWAQTPILLFFRQEFEPVGNEEPIAPGDVISFMSRNRAGYHFHSGIWIKTANEEGLVHSSPSSDWDGKSGPKYTPIESPYYQFFLFPMKEQFARHFGASVTRLREAA